MNEFIVWDDRKEVFFESNTLQEHEYGYVYSDSDRFKGFPYIGKKDINSKKIYADCSIVEFDKYSCGHSEQLKGFIRESSPMIFQIVILDNDIWNILYWHEFRHSIKNIKIIDTIQENKYGLIKKGKNEKVNFNLFIS